LALSEQGLSSTASINAARKAVSKSSRPYIKTTTTAPPPASKLAAEKPELSPARWVRIKRQKASRRIDEINLQCRASFDIALLLGMIFQQ